MLSHVYSAEKSQPWADSNGEIQKDYHIRICLQLLYAPLRTHLSFYLNDLASVIPFESGL